MTQDQRRASASYKIVQPEDGPPLAVAADDGECIFATPTLMDSPLHTGESSIAVSPVLPANRSRPLIAGDVPWGTSNATSLWWRSRDDSDSDDDNDGIRDELDDKGKKKKQKKKYASAECNSADTHAMDVSVDTLQLFAIVEGINAEALNVEIRNPAGALLANSVSTPGPAIATAVPLGTAIYTIKVSNPTGEAVAYELTLISRSNWL